MGHCISANTANNSDLCWMMFVDILMIDIFFACISLSYLKKRTSTSYNIEVRFKGY